jgi:hypothetical protein
MYIEWGREAEQIGTILLESCVYHEESCRKARCEPCIVSEGRGF